MQQKKEILNGDEAVARQDVEIGKEAVEEEEGKEKTEEDAFVLEIKRETEIFNSLVQTLRELIIFIKQPTEESKEDEPRTATEIKQKLDEIIKEVSRLLEIQGIYIKEADEVLEDFKKVGGGGAGAIKEKSEKAASFIKEIDRSAKEISRLKEEFEIWRNKYIAASLNEFGFKDEHELSEARSNIWSEKMRINDAILDNKQWRYGFGLWGKGKKEITELKDQFNAAEEKLKQLDQLSEEIRHGNYSSLRYIDTYLQTGTTKRLATKFIEYSIKQTFSAFDNLSERAFVLQEAGAKEKYNLQENEIDFLNDGFVQRTPFVGYVPQPSGWTFKSMNPVLE